MPMHDWTRVTAGTYHDFHLAWIAEIRRCLNGGLLPEDYYALSEQRAGDVSPDVLTLENLRGPLAEQGHEIDPASVHARDEAPPEPTATSFDAEEHGGAGLALAESPPRVAVTDAISEAAIMTLKQKRITIRHATDDRVVALLEIVSPGNKDGQGPVEKFVDKAQAALQEGYHLLVIDPFPPRQWDPHGLHDLLWCRIGGKAYKPPTDKPLTLSAYRVDRDLTCYVEPISVGVPLPEMPLFFEAERYVNVPLESTYDQAWQGVPKRWRRVIEGT